MPPQYQLTSHEAVETAGYGDNKPPTLDIFGYVVNPYAWLGDNILRKAQFSVLDPRYASSEIQVRELKNFYNYNGDSGGPAYIRVGSTWYFSGVDNWGGEQDGHPVNYEIFSDVRSHLSWIKSASQRLRNGEQAVRTCPVESSQPVPAITVQQADIRNVSNHLAH